MTSLQQAGYENIFILVVVGWEKMSFPQIRQLAEGIQLCRCYAAAWWCYGMS
jgi:hypothetical protein